MNNKLSFIENTFYFSGWTIACLYSIYKLVVSQNELFESHPNIQHTLTDLNTGWRFLRRLKDDSDVEWTSWKYWIYTSWFYMLLQFFISEIIRRTYVSVLKYWYLISSVIYIVHYMGVKQLIITLGQPIIYWGIVYYGGKRKAIWVTSVLLLVIFNSIKYKYYLWQFLDTDYDEEVFLMLYAVPWLELRCISFCVDYADKTNKVKSSRSDNDTLPVLENILNMFCYVLYLPVLFVGPMVLYEEFERSFYIRNEKLLSRLKRFVWDMLLYLIYTLLLDLAFHYIYFFAMQNNIKAVEMLPSAALCGGGLWMGLEFHLKYLISYGTSASYCRLDHIEPPPTPRCIARIHLYSQMWRYFDVGLYRFLFKYIHVPIYNTIKECVNMSKLFYKLISSFNTFIFIFMWHGTTWNIFVWTLLNYLGITLEQVSKAIGEGQKYKWFKEKVLRTDAMEARFIAFLCAPLLGLSAISNFYLFAGNEVGNLYFGLFRYPSLFNCALVYLSLYCCCHVCVALKNVPSRTDTRKIDNKTV